jgi:hypothetical protein
MKWMPVVYVNFLLTIGFGLVVGFGTGYLLKFGYVRNPTVAGATAFVAGFITVYYAWSGHIYYVFSNAPVFSMPQDILAAMKHLYSKGSWGIGHNGNLTGLLLAIVWVGEAFMILCVATVIAASFISEIPFCENTGRWLDEMKKIDTLQAFTDPAHLAAFRANDIGPLADAKPKDSSAQSFARLTLKYSPVCRSFFTLRVENISLQKNQNGGTNEVVEKLTPADLILPQSMFDPMLKLEIPLAHALSPGIPSGPRTPSRD